MFACCLHKMGAINCVRFAERFAQNSSANFGGLAWDIADLVAAIDASESGLLVDTNQAMLVKIPERDMSAISAINKLGKLGQFCQYAVVGLAVVVVCCALAFGVSTLVFGIALAFAEISPIHITGVIGAMAGVGALLSRAQKTD
jgi:hypothetical protein